MAKEGGKLESDEEEHEEEDDMRDQKSETNQNERSMKETFQFFDANDAESQCIQYFQSHEPWADKIKLMTGNARVISHLFERHGVAQ